jgi:hypothetical protein
LRVKALKGGDQGTYRRRLRLPSCLSLDAELGQRLFELFEIEWLDDGFQFFHLKVNSASRGALQFKGNRSTRSLSNAADANAIANFRATNDAG